jgi:hypothetical protein
MSEDSRAGAPRVNTEDNVGTVQIIIRLMKAGVYVRGNITRSFSRDNATVSSVYEQLLVGYQPPR